jgi:hypothetical protein
MSKAIFLIIWIEVQMCNLLMLNYQLSL